MSNHVRTTDLLPPLPFSCGAYHFSKGVVPEDCELSLWLLVAVDDDNRGEGHDLDRHTELTTQAQNRLEKQCELLLHHRLGRERG